MKTENLENIEIDILLEAIKKTYGYDFSNYARASLRRRIEQFRKNYLFTNISDLIPALLHDKNVFANFISDLSVTVTEMFRDPWCFETLRKEVIPILKTYPFVKIWVAGCATGEEAYSLAILLKEENFLDKTHIYATDININSINIAKQGSYSIKQIKVFDDNYKKSGGKASLSDYYNLSNSSFTIKNSIKKHITYAKHNLVGDGPFGEINLILCRNVLIYFDKELQGKVVSLFNESLCHNGFICLGTRESLSFIDCNATFEPFNKKSKIYVKKQMLRQQNG